MSEDSEARKGALVVKIMAMGGRSGSAVSGEEEEMPEDKKQDQDEVNYMTAPAKCRDCDYFLSPASCEKVAGNISKNGYCQLFEIKTDEDEDDE